MMRKILNTIGEGYTQKAKIILEEFGQVDYLNLSQKELPDTISKYEILLVGLGLNVNKEVIEKGNLLKIIATATTGLDHIDIDYAEKKGVVILSLKGEDEFLNTITGTAELAFGLMIDLMRQISVSFDDVKNYHWDREKFRGRVLANKTFGVVGVGRLGRMMVRYGKAFGMKVIACDPYVKEFGCEKVDFDELVSKSDIVSIHVHLNKETENMFNKDVFEKMKDSAYLINTSRGKIVNEDDVLGALENKKIAGYSTDVLSDELNFNNGFSNHPLVEYAKNNSNLIIAPHIGGMAYEAREATDIFIAEKIQRHLTQ